MRTILHLSDIHLGTVELANKYLMQLEIDLKDNLKVSKLDYLVIYRGINAIVYCYKFCTKSNHFVFWAIHLRRDNFIKQRCHFLGTTFETRALLNSLILQGVPS